MWIIDLKITVCPYECGKIVLKLTTIIKNVARICFGKQIKLN